MPLSLIVTNAGRAALVNAQNTGTAPVTVAQIGFSGSVIAASAASTSLTGEFKRLSALSGDVVADDTIHMVGRDESADAYTVRAFALYLNDGTLFAIYGQATPIIDKAAQAIALLAIDVRFADIAATSLTFGNANFLNPPATETVQGVAEIATQAETDGGTDDSRIVTPKKLLSRLASYLASWGSDIWRASNDGSGSGLDADLLDGQQGSWYSNIIARLGFTPVNRAGDTVTGGLTVQGVLEGQSDITTSAGDLYLSRTTNIFGYIVRPNIAGYKKLQFAVKGGGTLEQVEVNATLLTRLGGTVWDAGNDGSGSGMDADLLDGQQGSWYGDIPARLGFAPVQQGSGVGQLGNVVKIGWSGTRVKVTVDLTDQGNLVFDAHIADVWRASTDGSGSGLDADLLDGQQGSWYADIPARLGFTPLNATAYTAADVLAKLATVDGSGSGVDADLLDGYDGSAYVRVLASSLVQNGGYRKYSDGFIECWGYVDVAANSSATFALPTAHSNWVVPSLGEQRSGILGDGNNTENISINAITIDGSGHPTAIQIWNADNFNARVWITTKGV